MWDHEWQPVDRYGSRYDYGLITNTLNLDRASRRPAKAWFFYNVPNQPEITGYPVFTLDRKRLTDRALAQGARSGNSKVLKFTRGFAAVAMAIERLKPRRVVVIGMQQLRDGVTGSRYYDPAALPWYVERYPLAAANIPGWAADEMPAGLIRVGPHDYAAESALIRLMAAEAGTEIVWDNA
jgi:hypothetical protein